MRQGRRKQGASSSTASEDKAVRPEPHFVLKKGHLGRYRFTLLLGDRLLKGDVRIGCTDSRDADDRAALAEIEALADALRQSVRDSRDKRAPPEKQADRLDFTSR